MKIRIMSVVSLGIGLALGIALSGPRPGGVIAPAAHAQGIAARPAPELAALRADVDVLKGKATDQSHVMADVGYHFANLWFAGENKNWPLAKFYCDETRAHINWAVRVIPVRKDSAGRDVDLKAIWQAIDSSIFSQINAAIEQKDGTKFTAAYRQGIEGCYACHKSSSKPYLRPQIPKAPPQAIINNHHKPPLLHQPT